MGIIVMRARREAGAVAGALFDDWKAVMGDDALPTKVEDRPRGAAETNAGPRAGKGIVREKDATSSLQWYHGRALRMLRDAKIRAKSSGITR